MLKRQGCLLTIHHSREQGMSLCMTNSSDPYLLTICSEFGNNRVCYWVLGIEQWAEQTLFGSNRTIISVRLKKITFTHTQVFIQRITFYPLKWYDSWKTSKSTRMSLLRICMKFYGTKPVSGMLASWMERLLCNYGSWGLIFLSDKYIYIPQKSIQSPFESFLALN